MPESILSSIMLGAIAVFLIMFFFWLSQVFTKNAGVIDIGWALGLAVLVAIYTFKLDGYFLRQMILFCMVSLWAIRLSALLIRRIIRSKKEDRRYQLLRTDWAPNINFKFFFLFEAEAVLDLILSIPFLIICFNSSPSLSLIEITGIVIWICAFAGEIIADEQLHGFIKKPENKGQVCQDGFWNYTRHPNYFFEWCMWIGYFIFALGSSYGWLAIIAPIIMFYLLTKVTGVPFAEAMSLKSKGDLFKEYQKTTSIFIPMPKKRID